MSRPQSPPEARFLLIRGPKTATRLALPAFGSLILGADETADVRVTEAELAPRAAEVFCDFDVGVKILSGASQRLAAGAETPTDVASGETVDLGPQDRLRIGPIELSVAQPARSAPAHFVWSRAYFETRLQELLWADGPLDLTVLRLRSDGLDPDAAEGPLADALAELDGPPPVLGVLGPGDYGLLVAGPESRARAVGRVVTTALETAGAEVQLGAARAEPGGEPAQLLEQASLRMEATAGVGGAAVQPPRDPAMEPVMRLVDQVARTQAPVLILGETGTGKDVLAQQIHERSDRAAGPFVRVNCIDLPETFLEESETNFLARAAGGTVLLDQVGGLSPRAQVSLGYLLEESSGVEHDVRFLAASNQDLARSVEAGSFRKDLYFRLNRVTMVVPPLRDRVQDILPLAEFFIRQVCANAGRSPRPGLGRATAAQLEGYRWPGNLRELRNAMERAVLETTEDTIGVDQLPPELAGPGGPAPAPVTDGEAPKPTNLRDEIAALEKRRILEALEAYPTQTEAAKALGIPLRTFLNRLDALGIPRARKPAK